MKIRLYKEKRRSRNSTLSIPLHSTRKKSEISGYTNSRLKISGMTIKSNFLAKLLSNFKKYIAEYILLFIIYHFFSLSATTLTVCETCQHKTIQSAIKAAYTNDTIEVKNGIYKESPVLVNKSITLIGIESPVIDGEEREHVVDISADNVRIEGFKIINSGVSDRLEFAAIHIENAKNCKIKNNILENNAYGIYLAKVEKCILENNISIGNAVNEVSGGNAIHLWSSEQIEILKNKVKKHRDGIYLEFSTKLLIEENFSEENIRYGLHFMFSNGNKFYRNRFTQNSTGVAIMFSKFIDVRENYFGKSKDENSYGVLLKDITGSEFSQNVFQENTIGISADNSSRNKFTSNLFKENGWAINMFGNSEYNEISGNNFIENVFDLSTNTRGNLNTYNKNYWDEYKGFDLNRDGIGDKPYLPVRLFSYWVNVYPFLMVLFQSPVIEFLEIAERAFPVMSPVHLQDEYPQIKKFPL